MTRKKIPRLFIASSSEGLEVAEYLQIVTDRDCESTIWSQGVFGLSKTVIQSLLEAVERHDYAAIVVSADDILAKRSKNSLAPRDNVLFELGLFMGALGPGRTFIVYGSDEHPSMPTDLDGVTYAPYRRRNDNNWRAALTPVAVSIREAIMEDQSMPTRIKSLSVSIEESGYDIDGRDSVLDMSIRYASDLIESLAHGMAGISHTQKDSKAVSRWTGNLLGMLQHVYSARQPDTYVAWLRSDEGSPRQLRAFMHRNLDDVQLHYFFSWNEGMAGKAWANGAAARHSAKNPHPWWVFREGCENSTYICVPVGKSDKDGGLLAVGSDAGFDTSDSDTAIVSLFAGLLSTTLE